MTNDELREKIRNHKIITGISYKKMAQILGLNPNSFYNWLNEQYDFSNETIDKLISYLGGGANEQ